MVGTVPSGIKAGGETKVGAASGADVTRSGIAAGTDGATREVGQIPSTLGNGPSDASGAAWVVPIRPVGSGDGDEEAISAASTSGAILQVACMETCGNAAQRARLVVTFTLRHCTRMK